MWQVHSVTRARRHSSWLAVIALIPVLAWGATACNSNSAVAPPTKVIMDKGTPYADLLVPKLQASVTDGAVGVPVDRPVTVSAGDGVLGAVTMVNAYGKPVAGRLSTDGLTWSTAEPLGYDKQYSLTAEALGLSGSTRKTMTFSTHLPDSLTTAYVLPNDGEVVGVGQPVAIRFDVDIPNRLAAQRAIKVTTNPPVDGAFYWLNNREVRWRPEHFWRAGTAVDVAVNIYGTDLGKGLFGQENIDRHFTIGDEVIATADDHTKSVTVRINGQVVKTMATSMGKNSTPTNNGTYIVGQRYTHIIMDSSTYGVPVNSPNGYRTNVDWATQISYSGIFIHAAPWSVGAQGYTNTSHGCLNVNTANAIWFYNHTKRGDVVQVVNTLGATLPGTDGLGDWNIPWEQWRAGNAKT
jgi:lipoprotein-anchoring transpeptidase ErfK/SrfK